MTRKELLKLFKHLCLLMLCALPVLILLDMYCFKNLNNGLVIFLNVIIGLAIIVVLELIIYAIKGKKEK